VSAFAVHHLDGPAKAALFARAAAALRPGGRLVLADVVIPADPADAVISLDAGYDLPSTAADQLRWLRDAGLRARVAWSRRDIAVLVGERPAPP
jgi:tRNA (cmo5U34)-methyltransferase